MPRAIVHAFLVAAICPFWACSPSGASKTSVTIADNEQPVTTRPEKPFEFKLDITYYDINGGESITSTLIFRSDRVFQVIGTGPELIAVDLADGKVHIADVKKGATCEIAQDQVDSAYQKYIDNLREEARATLKLGNSPNSADARTELNLLDPVFTPVAESTPTPTPRFRLRSEAVDVSFTGEADPTRLTRIHRAIETLVKLRAYRNIDAIAPQAHLVALNKLKNEYLLRPTELIFLFRIANSPAKYRWTYILTPTLTSREWEAVRRIDNLIKTSRSVPFSRFERIIVHAKRQPGEPFETED